MKKKLGRVWVLPQEGNEWVMIMGALAGNGKRFTIGKGIGRIGSDGLDFTQICTMVFDRLSDYIPVGENMLLMELATLEGVERRLAQALEMMPDGGAIMFVCHDSEIIDEVSEFLELCLFDPSTLN